MIARSSPYRPANAENGATLTEHSPPRVAIRAGLSWRMILRARASCSMTIVLASTPSRSARPSSVIVTGTVRVGPSCGGRTAWRTAEPTAYPRLATSNGNSEAYSCTLGVPPPCHCGQIRRRLTSRDASLEWVVGPSLPGTRSQLTRKFSIDRGRQSGRPCGILGKSSGVSMVLVLRAFFPTALVGYARSDRAQTNAPGRLLVTKSQPPISPQAWPAPGRRWTPRRLRRTCER
jgi:hypothetical protein